jgi:PAS domain S-box-containing protein
MASGAARPRIIIGAGLNEKLVSLFPDFQVHFNLDHNSIITELYKPDAAVLFLPANAQESTRLMNRVRSDKYLEVLPIVVFCDEGMSDAEQISLLDAGANDFIFFNDASSVLAKKRIVAMATVYWKLKTGVARVTIDALARSVEFLDSLVENLPNMIFVKDASDLRFVRFNRAGEDLLGYRREDLIGKNDYDFFPTDQADHFTSKDRAVLSNGHLVDIQEEPIQTKKGVKMLRTKKIPLYDEKGNPAFLLGISEDITESKRAEQERLEFVKEQTARIEAEKGIAVRDEFITVASHELKTPLTSLGLLLQVTKRWIKKGDFSEYAVARMTKVFGDSFYQLDRLSSLVEDLLDISRIQRGKFSFNFETLELSKILKESVDRFSAQLSASHCELVWDELSECECQVDPFRIEQCIANLLSNAMKYGSGKPIEISLQKHDHKAVLSVRDHGIGIDPANQDKIFDRFERAVSSRHFSGMGLGLYITREIMQGHHGTINVKSTLNEGSIFTLELPAL